MSLGIQKGDVLNMELEGENEKEDASALMTYMETNL
jgi:phosphotransferase system HPr-like phosphotransfer protein